jgi:uncharacterized protein (TIGR02271 family)
MPRKALKIAHEELSVGKRKRQTGRVRVQTRVRNRDVIVDEPLQQESVHVKRVDVNRYVARSPGIHRRGSTLVFPILEEMLVVEKRLLLKAELHVTRMTKTVRKPKRLRLRTLEPSVRRLPS